MYFVIIVVVVCSEGACIVVRGQLIAAAFTKQLYNPQCFLQYEDPTMPPNGWNVISLVCNSESFNLC